MKALILAAGYGTRLKPYTDHTPKPLFTIGGITLLDRIIGALAGAGCSGVLVNTHHLGERIQEHLAGNRYPVPVFTRHEPIILGTGGAIRNAADFLDRLPFFVVNSDIVTDIDLAAVYRFHAGHADPATLVLVDDPRINTVAVDHRLRITDFSGEGVKDPQAERFTFTGIQVLDRSCLDFIPEGRFSSSIDAYRRMMAAGLAIRGVVADGRWADVGTPERYTGAAAREMAESAFQGAFPGLPPDPIQRTPLAGDGSDRRWHRLTMGDRSMILADHGIRRQPGICEADAFVHIGAHLFRRDVPVPRQYLHDTFSGLVFMEDLGDLHLQQFVRQTLDHGSAMAAYRRVIDGLVFMSRAGALGFDPAWTHQTPAYTEDVVITHECRYFVEAFLNGYLEARVPFEALAGDFAVLAGGAVQNGLSGFMHRDFQSRNIMMRKGHPFFIDFQGGRMGPLQYDLASLLMDPYAALPAPDRDRLLAYAMERLRLKGLLDARRFTDGYVSCCLTRNLQILGAFGFLTRVKGKKGFAAYIPRAVATLKGLVSAYGNGRIPRLKKIVMGLPDGDALHAQGASARTGPNEPSEKKEGVQ